MTARPYKGGRVLVVAGSDSGGGAGIQADIKAIMAQGAYATTAITALTAQNTKGVQAVENVAAGFVATQMQAVLQDIGADIIKTGMLASRDIVEVVAEHIATIPTIIDPVMVATSGDILLQKGAIDALDMLLVRTAFIVTPNLPEAGMLVGHAVEGLDDMRRAADILMERGAHAALIKGGHNLERGKSGGKSGGAVVQDLLALQSGQHVLEHPRLQTQNTHGTGCSLASALAANLANTIYEGREGSEGSNITDKIKDKPTDKIILAETIKALDYIHDAIASAPQNIGTGSNKPINHNCG